MLRFANVVMSNPARPELKPLELKALITGEDFGLAIGEKIAERLGLKDIDMRTVQEAGKKGDFLVPYMGPVRISCGGKDVFTGAMNCIQGIAIGAQLARELHIDADLQIGSGYKQGLLPFVPSMSVDGEMPDDLTQYIWIKERVLDEATCQWVCAYAEEQKRNKIGVEVVENSVMPGTDGIKKRKEHARDAFMIDTSRLEPTLGQIYHRLFTEHIMPHYGVTVESWERPQLLSYERGGKYEPHSDGEVAMQRPGAHQVWRRIHHRDLSILLYLNDDFTGGELRFPKFNMVIRPKRGLMVAFPSTGDYMHGAEPTHSGDRLVLVTWAKLEGTPRMLGEGHDHVYMNKFNNKIE